MNSTKQLGFYVFILTILTFTVGFSTTNVDVRAIESLDYKQVTLEPKTIELADASVLTPSEDIQTTRSEEKEVPVVETKTFYQVTSTFLNVRKSADKDAKIIDVLVKDWIVEAKEISNSDWLHLSDGGFINGKYAKEIKENGEKLFVDQKSKKKPTPVFHEVKKVTNNSSNVKSGTTNNVVSTGNINTSKNETQTVSSGNFSNHEIDLLARLVRAEAKGEPYEGKVAVAIVVLNRIDSGKFPSTMEGVIYQAGQFSPVSNGSINKPADAESKRAAVEAINSSNTLNGSLYFYNPSTATSRWLDGLQTTVAIGAHVFKR